MGEPIEERRKREDGERRMRERIVKERNASEEEEECYTERDWPSGTSKQRFKVHLCLAESSKCSCLNEPNKIHVKLLQPHQL